MYQISILLLRQCERNLMVSKAADNKRSEQHLTMKFSISSTQQLIHHVPLFKFS